MELLLDIYGFSLLHLQKQMPWKSDIIKLQVIVQGFLLFWYSFVNFFFFHFFTVALA